jgi:hypothetical protein
MNFAPNFQGPKLRVWQELPKLIPKFERKPDNFPKFKAKMNYCVRELGFLTGVSTKSGALFFIFGSVFGVSPTKKA